MHCQSPIVRSLLTTAPLVISTVLSCKLCVCLVYVSFKYLVSYLGSLVIGEDVVVVDIPDGAEDNIILGVAIAVEISTVLTFGFVTFCITNHLNALITF